MSQRRRDRTEDASTPRTRRGKVEEAIKKIRQFHALGRNLCQAKLRGKEPDRHFIRDEAERQNTNQDRLRKARVFADENVGYNRQELARLCQLIREVQSSQEERLGIFGPALVMRLLSVPKGERGALQREAIEGGWSFSRLDREIARRYGPRREGGRRPRIASDLAGFLTQVEAECVAWERWREELARRPEEGETRHVLISDLSKTLQESITAALEGIKGLHGAVAKELKTKEPGRKPRSLLQEPEASSSRTNGKKERSGRG